MGSNRPPLYMFPLFFVLTAIGTGAGDYVITHDESVIGSSALGVGCGAIVLLVIWKGKGHSRGG
jgi:hypothetical protein